MANNQDVLQNTRGREIFYKNLNPANIEIGKTFEGKVGVMHTENYYAAKTLAEVINNLMLESNKLTLTINKSDIITLTDLILLDYSSIIVKKNKEVKINKTPLNGKKMKECMNRFINAESLSEAQKRGALDRDTNDLYNRSIEEFGIEFDGFEAVVIDVTNYISTDNLSVEGARKNKLIPQDFDTQENSSILIEDNKKWGRVELGEDSLITQIFCPFCDEKDVYFISSDYYGCLNCNEEFNVYLESENYNNTVNMWSELTKDF